ncbi:MAG TPA: DUF72 domain-containing protein [Candidatus Baltobacteraceae bacterium]|jgi:uncharacterized protein YecE (DUF72 family)
MIYVGTCGYAYKDWIGPFYPGTIKPAEMLGFYARHFGAVEIDASYYGVPAERTVAGMASRTPEAFRFCFKVPKSVTHPPGGAAPRVHDDAKLFRTNLQPLLAARKLGAVLIQFPNGFKPSAENERYLAAIAGALDGLPLVAEFRHREWQRPATLALLRELGVGWCNVDMPQFDTLLHPSSDVSGSVGYVRLHGRNAAQWWTGDNVTRYTYTYSPDELVAWSDRIAEIEAAAETTFAFFNNHARGGAARNAEMLEQMLEQRYGEAAAEIVARPALPPPAQPGLPGLE